jgi:nuclear GTP-binding protein
LKKDQGVPAFFRQRRQAEKEQQEYGNDVRLANGKEKQQNGDVGMADMSGQMLSKLADGPQLEDDLNVASQADDRLFERASRDLALIGKRDNSVKAFMRDMKNVIDNSDVLLQVLDARDPQGSRSRQTERLAMSCGKKVVLILNKVDLIPASNLQAWLRYLRNDFPTLAFKASTQQQRSHLKQGRGQIDVPQASSSSTGGGNTKMSFGSEAIGANALLQLLKNYARTAVKGSSVKQQLTVGVVGPPNVGKSSLINSLLRTRACAVASTPGWTKVVQGVMLEKGIRLLDCPGVALNTGSADGENGEAGLSSDEVAWNMLRNTVKVELIEDPIAPIQAMLKRVDAPQLEKLYNIEGGFNEGDAHDFLLRVALLRGKLARGGIPDLEGAAKIVLHDWNIGRISFYSEPPAVHASLTKSAQTTMAAPMNGTDSETSGAPEASALTAGSSLVSGFADAFDLAALLGEADAEAFGQGDGHGKGKDLVQARERVFAATLGEADQAEAIEVEDEEAVLHEFQEDTTRSSLGKRRRAVEDNLADSSDEDDSEDGDDGRYPDDIDESNEHGSDAGLQTKNNPTYQQHAIRSARQPLSHRQRELQTAFGEEELASMAQKRGDVRKAAKKAQKRLRKSGAGLVDVWKSAMDLQSENGMTAAKKEEEANVFLKSQDFGKQQHDTSKTAMATHEEEEL